MKLNYIIGQNSLTEFSRWLDKQNYSSCIVLTDENTSACCYPVFSEITSMSLAQITIPAGEKNKNIKSCEFIWNKLFETGADRKSLLINLGGGMITDIGGFCASTFMRGIDYVNIPTSLLGMIDAAIGGKTGIDFHQFKNAVGNFYEAQLTFVYPRFLETLQLRQLNAAYGEMIKYNLLNPFLSFDKLYHIFGTIPDDQLIRACINTKIEVVRDDPYETKGLREVLNLGHTFGHAFETLALEKGQELLHGEAVALGIVAEMMLSERLFPDSEKHHNHVKHDYTHLMNFVLANFNRNFLETSDMVRIISIMKKDKKNISSRIRFILIDDHGKVKAVFVEEGIIKSVFEQFIQI